VDEFSNQVAGTIKHIELLDFMCHRRLTLDLRPHLNFIHGANGSGKSAVLTGLQVALGVKARSTHRADSMRSLIREDHPGSARVRVTLVNQGPDAFQPGTYGPTITVERIIQQSGTTQYRLLDAQGEEKSRRRSDMISMLEQFGIKPSNPVVILDQKSSKDVIQGTDASKYSFLVNGTDIAQVDSRIQASAVFLERTREVLALRDAALAELQRRVDVAEADFQRIEQRRVHEARADALHAERLWAGFVVKEEEVKKAKARAKEEEDAAAMEKAKVEKLEADSQAVDKEIETLNTQMQAAKERSLKARERREAAQRQRTQVRRPLSEAKGQLGVAKATARRERDAAKAARKALDKAMAAHARRAGGTLQALQAKLEQARAVVAATATERNALDGEMEGADTELRRCRSSYRDASEDAQQHTRKVASLEGQLRSLRGSQGSANVLARLHQSMPAAARAMRENAHRFSSPPVGPVGALLELNARDFGVAVQYALRNLLTAFVVEPRDMNTAMDVLRRAGVRSPNVVTWPLSRGPSTAHRPLLERLRHAGVHTVLDAVRVKAPVVESVLVLHASAERVALCKQRMEAEQVARAHREVAYAILPNTSSVRVRGGALSFESRSEQDQMGLRLFASEEESITALERDLARAQRDRTTATANTQRLRAELDAAERRVAGLKERRNAVLKRLNVEETARARLEQQIQAEAGSTSEEMVEAAQATLEDAERRAEEAAKAEAESQATLKRVEAEVTQALARIDADLGDESEANDDLQRLHGKLMDAAGRKQNCTHRLRNLRQSLADLVKKAEGVRAFADQKALECRRAQTELEADHPRPLQVRDPATVDREIETVAAAIRAANVDDPRSSEEIEAALRSAQVALKQKQDHFSTTETQYNLLTSANSDRFKKLRQFRKDIVLRTREHFNAILNRRGHAGALHVDVNRGHVRLETNMHGMAGDASVTDVRALSGGERSQTTLGFVLAVGSACESPFSVLDEPDIFMDHATRDSALLTIYDFAMAKRRQVIVITPQNLNILFRNRHVDPRKVHINNLRPPERRQHTLTEMREERRRRGRGAGAGAGAEAEE